MLLTDIFLHLRSETWTQWMIEAAQVKVHHRPFSFEDGPVVYQPACLTLVCEVVIGTAWFKSEKISKRRLGGWPAIAFLI